MRVDQTLMTRRLVVLLLAIAASVGLVLALVPTQTAAAAAPRRVAIKRTTTTVRPRAVVPATTSTTTKPVTTTVAKPVVTTSTTAKPATPTNSVLFGAESDDLSGLSTFESQAGKKVAVYGYYASFYWDQNFNTTQATAIANRGSIPMLTWEPWNPTCGCADQPAYSDAAIAGGAFDEYLARFAGQVKAWGRPMWIRFAHEMNGSWYPWSVGVNGNTASQYVAAYRHVVDVFRGIGATNVKWVWNPNVLLGSENLAAMYPGDAYVDWVGIDGYNFGAAQSWSTWASPQQVFGATLAAVRGVTAKPIAITETASTEQGGNKAQWIQAFFAMLKANPDIKAFFWFNLNKETDWRIASSTSAQAAFAAGVSDAAVKGA